MNNALKVETAPIDKPRPYDRNPRRNEAAVAKVAASIREFGWRSPIVVDEDWVILAGHTRLLAARQLGLTEVPVHVATGLTPAQRRAFRLADNRTAQEAEWDNPLLVEELQALLERQTQRFAQGKLKATDMTGGEANPQLAGWTALARVLLNLDETICKS